MESTADKVRALVLAVGLHALAVLLMVGGVWWTRSTATEPAAGPVIDAVLVDFSGIDWSPVPMPDPAPEAEAPPPPPQPDPAPPAAPPPQPEPEPRPQESPAPPQPEPQVQPPVPDTRDQERILQQQQAEAEAQRQREQEERRRQEQIDLTERQREQEEAERRERLAAEQREIEQRLADLRRQREAAEADSRRETERLQQIADRERPPERPVQQTGGGAQRAGEGGTDESLLAAYRVAIQRAVERHWRRPETIPPGTACRMTIRQIPGGEVISVEIGRDCPFDDFGRRSVENAVLLAQPLPYEGFETVFQRTLNFTFRAPQN